MKTITFFALLLFSQLTHAVHLNNLDVGERLVGRDKINGVDLQ